MRLRKPGPGCVDGGRKQIAGERACGMAQTGESRDFLDRAEDDHEGIWSMHTVRMFTGMS